MDLLGVRVSVWVGVRASVASCAVGLFDVPVRFKILLRID